MTSGTFHAYPIESIHLGARQRQELPDIPVLADSIRRLGLIHPLLITRDGELIAGQRRLEAVRSLGWTMVPVQFEDEADPGRLHALELEENTKRKDLTWQEQCLAIRRYHSDRVMEVTDWTESDTAAALGESPDGINKKLLAAKEIAAGNVAVAEAPKLSTAIGLTQRARERRASAETERALTALHGAPPERPKLILNEDFNVWAPTYAGPRFNLIHCDFPYGINADKMQQGYTPGEFGGYSDTQNDYEKLLASLVNNIDRLAQDQCHLVFWFSLNHYELTCSWLSQAFKLDKFFLAWIKSDMSGLLPDPQRGPRRVYETALFGSRGDRKIVRATTNAIVAPPSREIHMSEKPQAVLEHFFKMLVDESTSLLDPTAGSGSAIRAAKVLGAERAIGLEVNPEFAQRANERL